MKKIYVLKDREDYYFVTASSLREAKKKSFKYLEFITTYDLTTDMDWLTSERSIGKSKYTII